jgi:antitoxin (DNA-binding transcriptional repressor) of toxin-antitoxin stability system
VNVAELKNHLTKYLTFARGGEEVVIRYRDLPMAKLVPFSAQSADDQDLVLVAAGKLRLPIVRLDVKALLKIPTDSVAETKRFELWSPTEKNRDPGDRFSRRQCTRSVVRPPRSEPLRIARVCRKEPHP